MVNSVNQKEVYMIGLEFALQVHEITSTQLADKLGIAKQNVSRWFNGERGIPEKYLSVLEELLFIKREQLIKQVSDIEKLRITSTIYRNVGSHDENEQMILDAANIYSFVDTLEIKEKVDKLFDDYCNDFVMGGTYLDILENIEIIIKSEKINPNTLADILSTILYNMESKTEMNDKYIKSFTKRDLPNYKINFEKKFLDLISKYEIAQEKYERKENPSMYEDE